MPETLGLVHIEVHAGRSTQATLLGRDHDTYESLYLSTCFGKGNLTGQEEETANGVCVVRMPD